MRKCLNCQKELKRKKLKKFCSLNCRIEYIKKNKIKQTKKCLYCEEILLRKQKKYCSRKCRFNYEKQHIEEFKNFYKKRALKNIGKQRVDRKVVCLNCKNIFIRKNGRTKAKFCNIKCCYEYRQKYYLNGEKKLQKYCKVCGKEIRNSKIFCSINHAIEYRKNHREEYQYLYDATSKRHKDGKYNKLYKLTSKKHRNGDFEFLYKLSSERMKINNPSFNKETVKKQKSSVRKYYENHPEKLLERKANWINAPYRGRGYENRKPTSLEESVIDLNLENIRYTGDGKFWVTFKNKKHKNPDFKIKGQRKVIEVGDIEYWHTLEEIEDVKKRYKEISFECLYLTNIDINDKWEECVKKIYDFIGEENGIES